MSSFKYFEIQQNKEYTAKMTIALSSIPKFIHNRLLPAFRTHMNPIKKKAQVSGGGIHFSAPVVQGLLISPGK